jgi:hypothetical protein
VIALENLSNRLPIETLRLVMGGNHSG